MQGIDSNLLEKVGLENTSMKDYSVKNVVLRDGREAIVWVHKKTGHGILDPQYWENTEVYYEEEYRKQHTAEPNKKIESARHLEIYRELNQKQFATFSKHVTAKTKYLEVGCSFGGVFNCVAQAGAEVCHAVEPNREDAAFVQANNRQAKIYNTSFEKTDLAKDFYDLIVSIEVLEHVVSPKAFLEICRSVLRKGGTIHLEVPNHHDVLYSSYGKTGYEKFYYHKAHIHYFTAESLEKLCSESGFKGEVSSFLMYPFFNHVWWMQNKKSQPSALTALSTPVPTDGKTAAQKAINDFYQKTEQDYERLINQHMLGDCLIYQGRKIAA